ncbi:hypothetical protein [Aquabacterium terrae]|nr:hypothetical protein [Aquabacterium terrae]
MHPLRSAEILQSAGITDAIWLGAVAQHHEVDGGTGYPRRLHSVHEAAALVRRADAYTTMLSARAAMKPQDAARALYLDEQGHPMAAALVKEFGIYPPGCCVRLASGEMGIVVKRGPASNTPIVAIVVNRLGEPLLAPVRRSTAKPELAIVDVVAESRLKVRVSREQLALLGGD